MRKYFAQFLLFVCFLGCTNGDDSSVIKVGLILGLTGPDASFGTSVNNGIQLALEQVNAQGGVKGKKIKLIAVDDQGKPEEAAIAVDKLVTQEKVLAVIGEFVSGRSLIIAPLLQQYKIPMLSPGSTNPRVTEVGDYIFRNCFIDPFQGTVMAKFALEVLKIKKVALLRDLKNDYSIGLADFFKEAFKKGGGEIVIDQSYSSNDVDFKAQLTSIRAKKPQAIFLPGYYTEVALVARQAKELGINVPLLGGDGWGSPKLIEIAGKSIDGNFFSTHFSPEDQAPMTVKFVADYKKKYSITPDAEAALGYDALFLMADAISRAQDISSLSIKEALRTTKDFVSVTGKMSLDEKRNPIKSAVILKVVDGQFKYQQTVAP